MNKPKHTPGPWVATKFMGTYGGPDTWGVRLSNDTGITPMLEANARLIAAAPELLEACREALKLAPVKDFRDLDPHLKDDSIVLKLLEVIQKATGGAQ